MLLLCDVGQAEAHFGPFRDSVNLDTRLVHVLRRTCNRHRNRFGRTRYNSKVTWVKRTLISVHLEVVLTSIKYRWTVCTKCTMGMEIFMGKPNGTPRWCGEACFGLFGYCVNLDTRYMRGLRKTYHRLRNHFGHTRWYSYMTWVKWKVVLVHLEIMLISTQDRCLVCTERTKGTEIFKGASNGAPWWRGSNGSSFRSVWR
jgi:hypothetical protein